MIPRPYVSGSAMPLAARCPGSAVLPRVLQFGEAADPGNVLHEHVLVDRPTYGVSEAMARLPAVCARWGLSEKLTGITIARARSFDWQPPKGAVTEYPLALGEEPGTALAVVGGRGDYQALPQGALCPTTIDCMWAEPDRLYLDAGGRIRCPPGSVLWVADLKTGSDAWVEDVERNLQLATELVAAAAWTGAEQAIPAVIYLRPGPGVWDVPERPYYRAELEQLEQLVRAVSGRVDAARVAYAEGRPLPLAVGPHCAFCESQTYCPAKLAELKSWLADPQPIAPVQLTREQARRLAEMQPAIERFANGLRAALIEYVEAQGEPLELSNGKYWGPYTELMTRIDTPAAVAALADELGGPHEIGPPPQVSRASVERIVRQVHEERGIKRQVAPAMRRVMGGVARRDGLHKEPQVRYGVHTRAPELEEDDDAKE